MSYLKISSDSFLEKQELSRLIKFLKDDGYLKLVLEKSVSFGIIQNQSDENFDNFKIEHGTNTGTIKLSTTSFALDSNGLLITKLAEDNISLPDDNLYYWIKIKHEYSANEEGLVSIGIDGSLTGVGTKFTEVLRGIPNHQSVIKFTDASSNVREYQVLEVISDTSVILSGVFSAENDLHYKVIGTFTPGVQVPTLDKDIFQYDSCIDFTVADEGLVLEDVVNTAPAKIEGEEFYIARVKRNGSTVTVEDKRTEFWKMQGESFSIIRPTLNALIGIENIKYDHTYATKDKNIIQIGWGARSSNWTSNSELRRITINSIDESGKFKSSSNFTTGDFDGWRIYNSNGKYNKIISSSKSGSQINLQLDYLNLDDYINGTEVVIVPDVEEIEVKVSPNGAITRIDQIEQIFSFNIATGYGKMFVLVPVITGTYLVNIKYRYKNSLEYSDWSILPSDNTNGYYNESSYDGNGNFVTGTRQKYTSHLTNGYITLTADIKSYYNRLSSVDRGDISGVTRINLNSTGNNPLFELGVGEDTQIQIFEGNDNLSDDWFIHLKDGLIPQNAFYLYFENILTLSGFHLRIVENYVSSSVYDELFDFDEFYVQKASEAGLMIKCVWEGSQWNIFPFIVNKSAVINRGVISPLDFSNALGNLIITEDGVFHDLDLSNIVPDWAKLVILRVYIVNNSSSQSSITFKEYNTPDVNFNLSVVRTPSGVNQNNGGDCLVFLNDRKISYKVLGTLSSAWVSIGGWM